MESLCICVWQDLLRQTRTYTTNNHFSPEIASTSMWSLCQAAKDSMTCCTIAIASIWISCSSAKFKAFGGKHAHFQPKFLLVCSEIMHDVFQKHRAVSIQETYAHLRASCDLTSMWLDKSFIHALAHRDVKLYIHTYVHPSKSKYAYTQTVSFI